MFVLQSIFRYMQNNFLISVQLEKDLNVNETIRSPFYSLPSDPITQNTGDTIWQDGSFFAMKIGCRYYFGIFSDKGHIGPERDHWDNLLPLQYFDHWRFLNFSTKVLEIYVRYCWCKVGKNKIRTQDTFVNHRKSCVMELVWESSISTIGIWSSLVTNILSL